MRCDSSRELWGLAALSQPYNNEGKQPYSAMYCAASTFEGVFFLNILLCFCIPFHLQIVHLSMSPAPGEKRKVISLKIKLKKIAQLKANVCVLSTLKVS